MAKRGQFEFSSKLIRSTICAQIQKKRRRVVHGNIARAIECLHGEDATDFSELLAHHYGEAGNHEKAWKYLILAGDKARDVAAARTARSYYEAASESLRKMKDAVPEKAKRWAKEIARVQSRLAKLG